MATRIINLFHLMTIQAKKNVPLITLALCPVLYDAVIALLTGYHLPSSVTTIPDGAFRPVVMFC